MFRIFLTLLFLIPTLASAEEVVLGLSKDNVAITTSFDGSEILIFGAVKREAPIDQSSPLEVVITVAGPSEPVVVRRKENVFGIWVNTDAVEVDAAPSFYAVATTGPIDQVLSNTEDLRQKITIDNAIRSVGAPANITDAESFTDAVIRIKQSQGLYQTLEGQVALDQQTLFRTSIDMPADLTEGDYATRIFLTRDGQIVGDYETSIAVQKVGLERFLFNMSREQPVWYGLMSLAIAIAAGWGASAVFRIFRAG
ncbi:Putative transmembrane protein (Alph_Pro_TM) [Falsiruegeria litorea R37]|uniref:Putative transmembrane protein (Alph_Pro_TM) n=1 Tax=Falsiruegeria litorea R37 TaxID=1200284 RepID=A0A1Y5TL74_9RHOB|nr:TIGR02186 family protein [Falsiruegeria litorea]SLN66542.1 Putative transmembrane protein (Alph_Pro_TM) [Falsiruegeria litorea R37]